MLRFALSIVAFAALSEAAQDRPHSVQNLLVDLESEQKSRASPAASNRRQPPAETKEMQIDKKVERARACNEEREFAISELQTCDLYNTDARGMIDEWTLVKHPELASLKDQAG